MLYDLDKELQRQLFIKRVKHLLDRKVAVEISEKTYRTKNQNAYLHLLIGIVAMETGNTIAYAKEQYFKKLVNPDLFIYTKIDEYIGKANVVRSSADLTKEEMSMAIDRFKRWGSENGIYMPEAHEENLLQEVAIEIGRNKKYL